MCEINRDCGSSAPYCCRKDFSLSNGVGRSRKTSQRERDCWQETFGLIGGQDQDRIRWRLFEGLEQGIGRIVVGLLETDVDRHA